MEGYNADNGTWIGQFPQLVQQFAPYMTLTQIYNKYISSPLGQKYGKPIEKAADIKAIYDYYRSGKTPE